MTEGNILYRRDEDACLIKLVGCIRFTIGGRFESFIRKLFVADAPRHVTIDLTDTEHIDSTGLGLLARLARYMAAHNTEKPVISTGRDDLILLLETMGFDRVFAIRNLPSEDPGGLSEIPLSDGADATDAHTILDAHRTLMGMDKRNVARFRDAVELMEEEVRGRDGHEDQAMENPDTEQREHE